MAQSNPQLNKVSITIWDWPRCARCDMPVEEFECFDEHTKIILVARCHGKEQIVEIPETMLEGLVPSTIQFGAAFADTGDEPNEENMDRLSC